MSKIFLKSVQPFLDFGPKMRPKMVYKKNISIFRQNLFAFSFGMFKLPFESILGYFADVQGVP